MSQQICLSVVPVVISVATSTGANANSAWRPTNFKRAFAQPGLLSSKDRKISLSPERKGGKESKL